MFFRRGNWGDDRVDFGNFVWIRENKKVKLVFHFCHSNTVRREQMKKSSLRRAMVALCAFGLLSMGMAKALPPEIPKLKVLARPACKGIFLLKALQPRV
jgi:hypothetical protein